MELLCARFHDSSGSDCLAIWLPDGNCEDQADVALRYVQLSQAFDFRVVLVTRLGGGPLSQFGDHDLIQQLEATGIQSLDWRMTEFSP